MIEQLRVENGNGADPEAARIADLAARAKQGDTPAFEQLVARYWSDIFRMAYYRTSSKADAEELTQDIFMKAFRNISRLKEADRFKPWLYSIGLNRIRDYYRHKRVRSVVTLFSESNKPEAFTQIKDRRPSARDEMEKKEFWEKVGRFVKTLPRAEQEVFRPRFLDQLTLKEAAQALGKNESTVKTHLYRALGKLRNNRKLLEVLG